MLLFNLLYAPRLSSLSSPRIDIFVIASSGAMQIRLKSFQVYYAHTQTDELHLESSHQIKTSLFLSIVISDDLLVTVQINVPMFPASW